MLGNEAIFRGALEADVKVVAFYHGAPASEILDTFSEAANLFDYQMEISTNEKVALEVCAGASFAGFRSLTAMKSLGTNGASDTLHWVTPDQKRASHHNFRRSTINLPA